MEQDRFDKLAKKVFEARSRRSVVGGAIAGVVGAGVAAVTGASAKDKKSKVKAQGKKGKTRGEALCPANPNVGVACNTVPCTTVAQCQAAGCVGGVCLLGVCTAGGTTTPACQPGSCCVNTDAGSQVACLNANQQTNSQTCGSATTVPAGGGVCRTCPTGTRCSGETGNAATRFRCVCDPASCATGCCIRNTNASGDDQCVVNGTGTVVNSGNPQFNGASVCGTGGGTCNICSTGGLTQRGCCSATGTCEAGTASANCGTGGNVCTNCTTTGGTCSAQACTAGTTTAGPTTVGPTTPAPPPGQLTECGPSAVNPANRCQNGCCSQNSETRFFTCEPGGAKGACGKGGVVCKKCGGRKKCSVNKGVCRRIKNR